MDISNLIADIQRFTPEFASSYCVVNGAIMKLDEIQNMGYDEFSLRSKINMPLHLYRYYPNTITKDKETGKEVNYSTQASENNTVFLQTPTAYDNVYDSDINIDYSEYEHLRLIEIVNDVELKLTMNSQHKKSEIFLSKLCGNIIPPMVTLTMCSQKHWVQNLNNYRIRYSHKRLQLNCTNLMLMIS